MKRFVSIDSETFLIDRTKYAVPPLVCISYATGVIHDDGHLTFDGDVTLVGQREAKRHLLRLLASHGEDAIWLGHNVAGFDWPVFMNEWPDLIPKLHAILDDGRLHDTMIRAWLGDTAEGRLGKFTNIAGGLRKITYGLDFCVYRATGKDYLSAEKKDKDSPRLRYSEMHGVPVEQWPANFVKYAKDDVRWACVAYEWQEKRWGSEVLFNQGMQAQGYWALACTEGLYTDAEAVEDYEVGLQAFRGATENRLVQAGLLERKKDKVTAKKKPAEALYLSLCNEFSVDPTMTEKGNVSMGEESLDDLFAALPPDLEDDRVFLLDVWSEYKRTGSLLKRDVEVLRHPVVTTRYGFAATGRTTSSRGGAPCGTNLQNFARKGLARECCIPPEGYWMCSIDFSSAELVGWSEYCWAMFGFSKMGEAINAGLDPHLLLGESIAGHPITKKDMERQFAKIGNFGRLGMMGDEALSRQAKSQGISMTPAKAKEVIRAMDSRWTELPLYFALAQEVMNNRDRMVESYKTGRWRRVERITQAANTPFQGLIADVGKHATYKLVSAYLLRKTEFRTGAFVHDEALGFVPKEGATECAYQATGIMLDAAHEFLDHVTMRAEPAIAARWYKAMETVKDSRGQLLPWTPEAA